MSKKFKNIFFLFGVVAIFIMFVTTDLTWNEIWHSIHKIKEWICVIFLLWVLLYMMNALTWRIILKGNGCCNISFLKLLKITISGFALNYATPAGLMGGEPYKIFELVPYVGRERATSSVLLFSMMHIFAHFCFWFTTVVLCLLYKSLSPPLLLILASAFIFSLLGIYMFLCGYKNGFIVNLILLFSRIPCIKSIVIKFVDKHHVELSNIDRQISELHQQKRTIFYKAFLLEFVGRILQSLEIFFVLVAFTSCTSYLPLFIDSVLIISFTSLFANILFFLPMQLGGREGGFVMAASHFAYGVSAGLFVSIICRLRELFWTAIGLILIKIDFNDTIIKD